VAATLAPQARYAIHHPESFLVVLLPTLSDSNTLSCMFVQKLKLFGCPSAFRVWNAHLTPTSELLMVTANMLYRPQNVANVAQIDLECTTIIRLHVGFRSQACQDPKHSW
jgi:hypothetical protein